MKTYLRNTKSCWKTLIKKRKKMEIVNNNLTDNFTPGQMKIINSEERRKVQWSSEDIATAISLKSVSPKT